MLLQECSDFPGASFFFFPCVKSKNSRNLLHLSSQFWLQLPRPGRSVQPPEFCLLTATTQTKAISSVLSLGAAAMMVTSRAPKGARRVSHHHKFLEFLPFIRVSPTTRAFLLLTHLISTESQTDSYSKNVSAHMCIPHTYPT